MQHSRSTTALPKLIYVAGTGRSGSTFLARALASGGSACHIGEVYRLPITLFEAGGNCCCGQAPRDCSFWQPILAGSGLLTLSRRQGQDLLAIQNRFIRTRSFRQLQRGEFAGDPIFQQYCRWLRRLYQAIARQAGGIVIDSSKLPGYGWILSQYVGLDLRVVHITRHPIAVAKAWQSWRFDQSKAAPMPRQSVLTTMLRWQSRMQAIEQLAQIAPTQHIRYEDLIKAPEASLQTLLSGVLAGTVSTINAKAGQVWCVPEHSLDGNPSRHTNGWVKVQSPPGRHPPVKGAGQWFHRAITRLVARQYGYDG